MTDASIPPPLREGSSGTVFQGERQAEIADLAMANGRVEVASLAKRFNVTTETIRRDLAYLQDQRLVRRVHGGAVPWERWRHEPRLSVRDSLNADEKLRIAKRALEQLPAEGSILVDSGSTLAHVAAVLPHDRSLNVVTNSIPVLQTLVGHRGMEVTLIGGLLQKDTLALVDSGSVDQLRAINVDLTFLSSDGVSAERGFTTPYRDEVAIKQAMMAAARRTVMLFDHSKVGKNHLHQFAKIEDVDTIITGTELPDSDADELSAHGPLVIRA